MLDLIAEVDALAILIALANLAYMQSPLLMDRLTLGDKEVAQVDGAARVEKPPKPGRTLHYIAMP
jgi:hypothetical protein